MNTTEAIALITLILSLFNIGIWIHVGVQVAELHRTLDATIEALSSASAVQRATIAQLKNLHKKIDKQQG